MQWCLLGRERRFGNFEIVAMDSVVAELRPVIPEFTRSVSSFRSEDSTHLGRIAKLVEFIIETFE